MIRHLLLSLLLLLVLAAPAQGAMLGTSDHLGASPEWLAQDAQVGSLTRVLIDPRRPLSDYDAGIQARRDAGLRLMIVIGGLYAGGTPTIQNPWGGVAPTVEQVVAVYRRYPDAFAYSLMNEPENAGWVRRPSKFRKTFNQLYRALKREGAKRVLLGEAAPTFVTRQLESWARSGKIVADGFSYHPYGYGLPGSIENTGKMVKLLNRLRHRVHTPRGYALPIFWTEYGVRGAMSGNVTDKRPVQRVEQALRIAEKYRVVAVVFYGVHGPNEKWDTALWNLDGSARAVASVFTR